MYFTSISYHYTSVMHCSQKRLISASVGSAPVLVCLASGSGPAGKPAVGFFPMGFSGFSEQRSYYVVT